MEQVLSPSVVFDSRGMSTASAIEAWQEHANPMLDIGIEQPDQARFSLSLQAIRLDETMVTAAETTAQSMHRDLGRARRDGIDTYGFCIQVTGSRIVRVNGNDVVLKQGDLQFVDMAQEDLSIATDGRTTSFYVPRDLVQSDVPDAWRLHGTIVRNTAAHLLANQVHTLFDQDSAWSPAMARYMERSLLSIAFGCLVDVDLDGPASAHDAIDRSMRSRIEHYIEDNLADFDLGAQRIGQEFGVSRSVIYRVFQVYGGLNRYILGCRLRRVRRLLLDGDNRTIGEVALANGFASPAHFSREFRRAFNTTPSDVRLHQQLSGHHPVVASSLDQFFRSVAH